MTDAVGLTGTEAMRMVAAQAREDRRIPMTERENRKKNFDLLAMGELLLRLSPPGNDRITRGDTFEKHIGGAELNVAAGVSLLGLRTGMISEIPDSAIGEFAKTRSAIWGSATITWSGIVMRMRDSGYTITRAPAIRENPGGL